MVHLNTRTVYSAATNLLLQCLPRGVLAAERRALGTAQAAYTLLCSLRLEPASQPVHSSPHKWLGVRVATQLLALEPANLQRLEKNVLLLVRLGKLEEEN